MNTVCEAVPGEAHQVQVLQREKECVDSSHGIFLENNIDRHVLRSQTDQHLWSSREPNAPNDVLRLEDHLAKVVELEDAVLDDVRLNLVNEPLVRLSLFRLENVQDEHHGKALR